MSMFTLYSIKKIFGITELINNLTDLTWDILTTWKMRIKMKKIANTETIAKES